MAQYPAASIVGSYLNAPRYANVIPDGDEPWLGAQFITIEDLAPLPDGEAALLEDGELLVGGGELPLQRG